MLSTLLPAERDQIAQQEVIDHRRLVADLQEFGETELRIPVMMRRLIDAGVDPLCVAKVALIGSRDGGFLYRIASRAHALADHEAAAKRAITAACDGVPTERCVQQLTVGAVWIAAQFGATQAMLRDLVRSARATPINSEACAVDLADRDGLDWMLILRTIDGAVAPTHTPLELDGKAAHTTIAASKDATF